MDKVQPGLRQIGPVILTALAYVLTGQVALWLASPPAFAAPLYPSAGLALAAALTWGRAGLAGVWLGALVIQLWLGNARGLTDWPTLLIGTLIAGGATAQAALGAHLVRRRLPLPRDLSEPREALLLFGLGGVVACLVSASVAVSVLWLNGLPGPAVVPTLVSWWSGDTLGVLLGAPVALSLIGQPRHVWAPRRLTVALPLTVVAGAVALATMLVARSDEQRSRGVFERDASRAADTLAWGLRTPLHALEAARGLYLGSDTVSANEFEAAASAWLVESPQLLAIGFSQRIARDRLAEESARIGTEDGRPWRVFERADAPAGLTSADTEVVAIRHVIPFGVNRGALGVNTLSIPAARQAIEQALVDDRPKASAGFHLTQLAEDETGVVIYRAVVPPPLPDDAASRRARSVGVVFVTLHTAEAARRLLAEVPSYLHWCLLDRSPGASRPLLAGAPAECLSPPPAAHLVHRQALPFADRQWELVLHADRDQLPVEGRWNLSLFIAVGLLSTAMLGALLLAITGRTRRVEEAVAERTTDLRHEVQERRRAEQALRDSEARWRNIVDHIPIGVVYADTEGRIRETNPQLRRMLGLDGATLASLTLDQLTSDGEGTRALLARLAQEHDVVQRRRQLRRADGQTIEVQVMLSVLRDAQGQPLRLVGVIEDVTEHLKLAQAERARESAEAASRAKSEFLSRVSHELRTPLNAILGFGQLLSLERDPGLNERQRGWNEQVQQAGWHLLSLINEMLDLARIESGEIRLALAPQDPAALLQECLDMLQPAAQARGVQVAPVQRQTPQALLADPVRLKQILTNLLSNAVKYNRQGGELQCRIDSGRAGTVRIEVRDQGEGLRPEQLAHLFEPFNRLGRESSGIEGTGLGLVISLRLAEAMGGHLAASSVPGQGSCFVLELPAADAGAADAGVPDPVAQPDSARQPARRVLYIEDNETNAEVMRGILGQRPQLALGLAATGGEGLAAALAAPPDLILLDMHLPDMDGLEVLARLQAEPTLAGVPVLAVSADATTERIARAQAAGVRGYVTKPVDIAHFLALVDGLL